jgi:SDR family mycofactocin-dependent oxidoreductase
MSTPERVALVTGAGRGIGAAVVRRLAEEGYAVLALDACAGPDATPYPMPTPEDLAAVAAGRPQVVTRVADVRDRAALADAVDDAVGRWGRLDVAVCAAAVMAGGRPLWETPDDELDLLWEVDARGVWTTAAVTVPAMLAGPDPSGCRFVAIASAAGRQGLFRLAGYTAVKHAVVGIVKGLAADLVGTGVTAVAVSPGSTRTEMLEQTAALYPDATVDDLVGHQLLHRVLEPEEVAETVAFCCSRTGGVLHGGVVHADGGFGV